MKLGKNVFVACILLSLLTGCATQQEIVVPPATNLESPSPPPATCDLIVLLPDTDGKAGAVHVTTLAGAQTLERPGDSTEVEGLRKPPTLPKPLDENEITRIFGPALSGQPDRTDRIASFILYFKSDTTKLTPESAQTLTTVMRTIRNRGANEVYVVGHTDRVGTEAYNRELSSRRAYRVRDQLLSNGVDSKGLLVSFHGEAMPLVHTKDEVGEPLNRRVEVLIR